MRPGRAQALELAGRAVPYGFARCGAARCSAPAKPPTPSPRRLGLEPRRGRAADGDRRRRLDRPLASPRSRPRHPSCSPRSSPPTPASPSPAASPSPSRRCGSAAALAASKRGPLPALVVCHGMVIRAALYRRARRREHASNACRTPRSSRSTRAPPQGAELGGGAATLPADARAEAAPSLQDQRRPCVACAIAACRRLADQRAPRRSRCAGRRARRALGEHAARCRRRIAARM